MIDYPCHLKSRDRSCFSKNIGRIAFKLYMEATVKPDSMEKTMPRAIRRSIYYPLYRVLGTEGFPYSLCARSLRYKCRDNKYK